ncbi:hypothetical protein [Sulfuricella sp.]|uniref:hypothetical protein n=1 Tax=Sulfuricella sp. TaxID=2099377 RepID=UPI002C0E8A71|nr:hypothetical protein [Sulfuricella sp.]HUX64790.1 hypothetical protein [Sulfuricella sp.]
MKKPIAAFLFVTIALAGCASNVVSSNERSVIVESQSMNAGDAQTLANAECAKHKRFARMASKADYWDRNYVFDCVQ